MTIASSVTTEAKDVPEDMHRSSVTTETEDIHNSRMRVTLNELTSSLTVFYY